MRFFIRALRVCQAAPPSRSSSTPGLLRAVARQQLDVLDRQEQLVAAGIMDFEAIVRRAGGFDGAQADEAADAVIDMHDEIAGGEARHLGDEIVGALGLPARCAPAARPKCPASVMSATSAVSKPDSTPSTASATCGRGSASAAGHDATGARLTKPVLGEHMRHALARAFAPQRDHRALAAGLQRVDVLGHRLEHIGAGRGALGGEIVAGMRADFDDVWLPPPARRTACSRASADFSSRSRHSASAR